MTHKSIERIERVDRTCLGVRRSNVRQIPLRGESFDSDSSTDRAIVRWPDRGSGAAHLGAAANPAHLGDARCFERPPHPGAAGPFFYSVRKPHCAAPHRGLPIYLAKPVLWLAPRSRDRGNSPETWVSAHLGQIGSRNRSCQLLDLAGKPKRPPAGRQPEPRVSARPT